MMASPGMGWQQLAKRDQQIVQVLDAEGPGSPFPGAPRARAGASSSAAGPAARNSRPAHLSRGHLAVADGGQQVVHAHEGKFLGHPLAALPHL